MPEYCGPSGHPAVKSAATLNPGPCDRSRRLCDPVNQTQPLKLCTSARGRDRRRKRDLAPWCSVGCHHRPQKRSWADAATSAQPSDTLPAQARTRGATLAKTSALPANNNPRIVTGGYQIGPILVTSGNLGHLASIRLILFAYRATGLLEVEDRPGGIVARIGARG